MAQPAASSESKAEKDPRRIFASHADFIIVACDQTSVPGETEHSRFRSSSAMRQAPETGKVWAAIPTRKKQPKVWCEPSARLTTYGVRDRGASALLAAWAPRRVLQSRERAELRLTASEQPLDRHPRTGRRGGLAAGTPTADWADRRFLGVR